MKRYKEIHKRSLKEDFFFHVKGASKHYFVALGNNMFSKVDSMYNIETTFKNNCKSKFKGDINHSIAILVLL